jgi:fructose 1,6-bisphosphate aldolase/phosphatase
MKTTLTAVRVDLGAVGGHLQPSELLVSSVRASVEEKTGNLLIDCWVNFTGDDITILCTHENGIDSPKIREALWDAFEKGAATAGEQGLYGVGQDIRDTGMTWAAKGLGPALAEMSFEERPNEAFLIFSIDKALPGAFNLPFYLAFADPMHCPGLILSPRMRQGFRLVIMDVLYKEYDREIELNAPEDIYNMAALLRDQNRYAIRRIESRSTDEQAVASSTTRMSNIAGKIMGKDDPVAIVRIQDAFPAAGEVVAPFQIGPYVGGFMRGCHHGPLMPVPLNTKVSYFDGPPIVSCAAFGLREGRLTPPVDVFEHPMWDHVRTRLADKAVEIRRQGFFGNAMQPFETIHYGGLVNILRDLDERFEIRRIRLTDSWTDS